MILLITILMLALGTALMMNIYSIFQPFMQNSGQITDYNQAYYGAISSVERAQLIVRMHDYGFEGSGGWLGSNGIGAGTDNRFNNFGKLSSNQNGMVRSIKSLSNTNIFPKEGNGNIDTELRRTINDKGGLSKDYNKLDIGSSLEIALYTDSTSNQVAKYYTGVKNSDFTRVIPTDVFGQFRIPPYVLSGFGGTDKLANDEDRDNDTITNDIIVNRMIFDKNNNFQIFPNTNVDYNAGNSNPLDTNIRESNVNAGNSGRNAFFSTNKNPTISTDTNDPNFHNITPLMHSYSGSSFKDIFANTAGIVPAPLIKMQFILPNIQLLTKFDNIYPFLEYKLEFNGIPIGQKIPEEYFHIEGTGKVGKYKISIKIDKKVTDKSSMSFSTITF